MLEERLRRNGFWISDFLKGGPVKKHYNDIVDKLNGSKAPSQELSNILNYAINNVEYYSGYKNIKQYQIIQTDKTSFILKVACDSINSPIEDELLNASKKLLGEKAKIKIEYVDKIPTEHTGKYKTTINLCK